MSLTRAFLLAAAAFTFATVVPKAAEAKPSCERIEKKLAGTWWKPWDKGCLGSEDIQCISNNLEGAAKCDPEIYADSVDTLLQNIFSDNETAQTSARIALHNVGILNHRKQMQELQSAARRADSHLRKATWKYHKTKSPSSLDELTRWKMYSRDLKIQSVFVADAALSLRVRPPGSQLPLITQQIAQGLRQSYETTTKLLDMEVSLQREDWSTAYQRFKDWKKAKWQLFSILVDVQKEAMNFGVTTAQKVKGNWTKIEYYDSDGKLQSGWATSQFAKDWQQMMMDAGKISAVYNRTKGLVAKLKGSPLKEKKTSRLTVFDNNYGERVHTNTEALRRIDSQEKRFGDYLPPEFKGIRLGMTYQELQRVRPSIKSRRSNHAFEDLNFSYRESFVNFFTTSDQDKREIARAFNLKAFAEYIFEDNKLKGINMEFWGRRCSPYNVEKFWRKGIFRFGTPKHFGRSNCMWTTNDFTAELYTSGTRGTCAKYAITKR